MGTVIKNHTGKEITPNTKKRPKLKGRIHWLPMKWQRGQGWFGGGKDPQKGGEKIHDYDDGVRRRGPKGGGKTQNFSQNLKKPTAERGKSGGGNDNNHYLSQNP